jgi:hypothetical protein
MVVVVVAAVVSPFLFLQVVVLATILEEKMDA